MLTVAEGGQYGCGVLLPSCNATVFSSNSIAVNSEWWYQASLMGSPNAFTDSPQHVMCTFRKQYTRCFTCQLLN